MNTPRLTFHGWWIAVVAALTAASLATAQENMFWRGGGGGLFQNAANWSAFQGHTSPATGAPNDPIEPGLPASNRRAVFELAANGTITFSGSASTADAQVLKGSAFFDLGGNTWTTGNTFSILAPFVNGDNNPNFTPVTVFSSVSNGTLNTYSVLVGAGDNRNVGTLTLSGATVNSQLLEVAQSATGTLNIGSGSIVNTMPGTVAAIGIGGQGGSSGTVNVSGSSVWNIGANGVLQVGGFGGSGSGVLNITSGAVNGSTMNVAMNNGINGTVTVNGSAASLYMSNGFGVGQQGQGTVNVLGGGLVTTGSNSFSYVGTSQSGRGTLSISGAGSRWNAGEISVGNSMSSITVSNGGLLDSSSTLTLQNGGSLDVQSSASLHASRMNVWLGGTAQLSGTVTVGVVTVDGQGSAIFQNGNNVTIDNGAGVGELNITNGAAYHGAPRIGLGTGAALGTANVSGNGTLWDIGDSYIIGAGGGLGVANINSSALVTSNGLFIGKDSNGQVTLSQSGSRWISDGAAYIGGSASGAAGGGITGILSVQNGATADIHAPLTVWSGGTVQLQGGNLNASSINVAGGTFNDNGNVQSTGTLAVSGGGSYNTGGLTVGGGGFSSANVSGGGASINASQISLQSGGALTIGAGGNVSAPSVEVFGGTLTNNGGLAVSSTLAVFNAGHYASSQSLEISPTGVRVAIVGGGGSEIQASSVNVRSQGSLQIAAGGTVTGAVNVFGGTSGGAGGGNVVFQNGSTATGMALTARAG